MFNYFSPNYKEWLHHGEEIFGHPSFFYDKGHNTTNTQSENVFGDINTMRILNNIFRVHENHRNGIVGSM